jgi:isopenicillin N synthase-like dioxygenase
MSVPVIDMAPLFGVDDTARRETAAGIARACEDDGFFQVVGHGVTACTIATLAFQASAFFALPRSEKARIGMDHGGAAWRGWFPLGAELTSGRPDDKEGIYFGEDLPPDDPRVSAGWPLHGANQWPAAVPGLRPAVNAYMAACARAASALMEGVSLALDLEPNYFARAYLTRPTPLFRIFRYPPTSVGAWGVGEHTDYGLLTLLAQDDVGGLEVKSRSGWVAAPPIPRALVCNIGDMLERLTGGRFVSTPHRVVNRAGRERLSFPFFYDPDFAAKMVPIPSASQRRASGPRWDGADVQAYDGLYGDYLLAKVGRVFPDLKAAALDA